MTLFHPPSQEKNNVDVGRTLDSTPTRWWTSFALSTLRGYALSSAIAAERRAFGPHLIARLGLDIT